MGFRAILLPFASIYLFVKDQYDVIVIGAGSAGLAAARAAREVGASVCVVEADRLGGDCPNWACVPSKALLRVAGAYRKMRGVSELGLASTGISFDWKKVGAGRQAVVDGVTGGDGSRYRAWAKEQGVDVRLGSARFIRPTSIEVDGERLEANTFVIATGSEDRIPDVHGLSTIPFLTSREAWQLDRLPKSMAIIGGGPVGCELATAFASFGVRVVLVESAATVLNKEESDLSVLVQEQLERLGVEIVVGGKVVEAINARGGVYGLKVQAGGSVATHAIDVVVVAVGRKGRVGGLGLETVGVAVDTPGFIATNQEQRTSAKHIWAAGDVTGGMLFTHVAHPEGAVAGNNAARAALGKRGVSERAVFGSVPRVTFVSPELASVGETVADVRGRLKKVLVGRAHVMGLARAKADRVSWGMCILVAHPRSKKILGCHILAPHAGEVIHEATLAIKLGTTIDDLANTIHAFPTYSEILALAAANMNLE